MKLQRINCDFRYRYYSPAAKMKCTIIGDIERGVLGGIDVPWMNLHYQWNFMYPDIRHHTIWQYSDYEKAQ